MENEKVNYWKVGLDLNDDDLFKVRLFEYLKDKQHATNQVFEEISNFYGKVKKVNEKWYNEGNSDAIVSILEIRTIYKDYLIAKYKLDNNAFDMGTDTFFDLLFDQLLGVQDQTAKLGSKSKNVILQLSDLYDILTIEEEWNRHLQHLDTIQQFMDVEMLKYSSYTKFKRIAYQVILKHKDDPERIWLAHQLLAIVSRIAFCQSIRWAKIVSSTATELKELYKSLWEQSFETTLETAQKHLAKYANDIQNCIGRPIFESVDGKWKCHRTWGNLICVLSECITETESNSKISPEQLQIILHSKAFDFEHIHATNDKSIIGIPAELQNSIGNLMLLEYDINRSIEDNAFKNKCPRYEDSRYATAQNVAKLATWDEEQMIQRKEQEISKIICWINNVNF